MTSFLIRDREKAPTLKGPCADGDNDWSDARAAKECLEPPELRGKEGFSLKLREGAQPYLDFRLLVSRPVGILSVV